MTYLEEINKIIGREATARCDKRIVTICGRDVEQIISDKELGDKVLEVLKEIINDVDSLGEWHRGLSENGRS